MSRRAPRPLGALRGIGPIRAAELASLGLASVEDLLLVPPVRYEDRRSFRPLSALAGLPAGVKAPVLVRVQEARLIRTRRRGFSLVRATVSDGRTAEAVVWFNQPYLVRHLTPGREIILYGRCQPSRGRGRPRQIENPELELIPAAAGSEAAIHMGRVVPVYRRLGPLAGRLLRRLVHQALEELPPDAAADPLPAALLRELDLPDRASALRALHFPGAGADPAALAEWATPAQRRLVLEELLLLAVALELRRRRRRALRRGFRYRLPAALRRRMGELLPFPLTAGQRQALRCIASDLRSPVPMARLLQGDVGAGKTLVAALTMWLAAENGCQAALMAPTEVLAEQLHTRVQRLLAPAGHSVGLFLGKLPAPRRRALKAALAQGRLPVVIGTHALLQDDVVFRRLRLVIIDEQQRFGVSQRLRLAGKGITPDLLVMTATPIPRSLALTRYGDLDLVEIRDRPGGRSLVQTEVLPPSRRAEAWQAVRRTVAAGRQVFVVYPLVEERDVPDVAAAAAAHRELVRGPLAGLEVGLLHGRLPGEIRQRAMARFATGDLQVLVATTVVEVGVDVPNATLMVVEHAHRFGLAQLHQLRGRVGRGSHTGHCLLIHGDELTPEAQRRLQVLARTADGFAIAQEDLALRGPGEVLGERQHGVPGLQLADLARDGPLLEIARAKALELCRGTLPRPLREAALRRWGRGLGLLEGG